MDISYRGRVTYYNSKYPIIGLVAYDILYYECFKRWQSGYNVHIMVESDINK